MQQTNFELTRRRVERIALPLPVRVEAKESKEVSWDEISRFLTISHCGAGFEIQHQLKTGQLHLLTAPLPQKLRCYDYLEPQYKVWGIVRYCNQILDNPNTFHVGVAFIGKNPPSSYFEDPAKVYYLTSFNKEGFSEIIVNTDDFVQEEKPYIPRKNARYSIPTEIFLESLDQNGDTIGYETTVSENVSVCGVSVFTSLDSQVDDFVKVNFMGFNVSILAKVRNRRVGADGLTRLHLEFIDRHLQLEGIE